MSRERARLEVVVPTRLTKSQFAKVQSLSEVAGIKPATWVRIVVLNALAQNRKPT